MQRRDFLRSIFLFRKVTLNEINNEVRNFDESKASQSKDISTKFMKENYDIFATFITENFNNVIENSIFPESLKQAGFKPVYKKNSRNEKKNYRPVSVSSNLSKIYGRCTYTHMNKHFDPIVSEYQFGFRKGYSAQQCLPRLKNEEFL